MIVHESGGSAAPTLACHVFRHVCEPNAVSVLVHGPPQQRMHVPRAHMRPFTCTYQPPSEASAARRQPVGDRYVNAHPHYTVHVTAAHAPSANLAFTFGIAKRALLAFLVRDLQWLLGGPAGGPAGVCRLSLVLLMVACMHSVLVLPRVPRRPPMMQQSACSCLKCCFQQACLFSRRNPVAQSHVGSACGLSEHVLLCLPLVFTDPAAGPP